MPIFKNGDKLDSSNYRPILLLSNTGKILEKAMCTRSYHFLDKFKYLYKEQFGFRNLHSANHALGNIVTNHALGNIINEGNTNTHRF